MANARHHASLPARLHAALLTRSASRKELNKRTLIARENEVKCPHTDRGSGSGTLKLKVKALKNVDELSPGGGNFDVMQGICIKAGKTHGAFV